ncbi:imidazole glycerol phosphate synthase subunit HisH [Aliarcobacter cryaerophilus]|uniref:imidazole glycerol phosphate synthase subunit HisH n=1 Tax=Aliarcobacter cryaerophilus TaxID=28198 RepID=UPI0021B519D4|nr:imidazole glycerol phosphate synthase subunit HisH [Aliarcobacter cryaerophilus]MCT7487114.1 imidazole glycerol phosphate synthase subunit HisH [Aliarcobacter cryaerophilus]MCT7491572.1 imidazole glycerol phosphate synthase subunit HisH [Aliarcobacter cryaerophilus]
MIVVIDYGMGNLGSIANMIKKVGHKSIITSDLDEIKKATKLILPGVGSFDNGMKNLQERGMIEVLNQKVLVEKIPILGICLGMQLMTKTSEEGNLAGLGWVDAETKKFVSDTLKIPHMGWNIIKHQKSSQLFDELESEKRFYFVHSYCVSCNHQEDILTTTNYTHDFVSSFEKENIIGVQFHPEKSHKFGMSIIRNFAEKY